MKTVRTTYKRISVCLIMLLGLLICQSCSKNTLPASTIRVQIEANSDAPVRIYGIEGSGERGLVVKKNYISTFKSEAATFSIDARCKDEKTLITIKVWVNGKLKKNVSGNKYLTSGEITL